MNNNTEIGHEIPFDEHELIVSMTNVQGNIIYANDIFCKMAGYSRQELLGMPHNIVRHEDMPKVVFKLLWERVLAGNSVYAFVKNKSQTGDFYWVKAFVTPVIENGEIVKIASYRRPISLFAKEEISKIYRQLIEYEKYNSLEDSYAFFLSYLDERGSNYDAFIDRLSSGKSVTYAETMCIDFDQFYVDHILFKYNILHAVREQKWGTEIVKPCCCRFGKQLKELESMPFTAHPSWAKAHHCHDNVHGLMEQYFNESKQGVSSQSLQPLLDEVEKNTGELFKHLHTAIDMYR